MTTPNRPPLSPAAQAVLTAASVARDHAACPIAAALRAAADQCADGAAHWELYAIAAELES